MSAVVPRPSEPGRSFLFLLAPLAAISLPSLVFCLFALVLWAHGALSVGPVVFHLPPKSGWDWLLSAQTSIYGWVSQWNSLSTLGATAVLVFTLLRPQWRHWAGLALIPYGVLLCADFTLRLHPILMP
jgi:hypothetical protein